MKTQKKMHRYAGTLTLCILALVLTSCDSNQSSSVANAPPKTLCDTYDCVGLANKIINYDARSWFFNSYDYGSAYLSSESSYGFKVNYTYNGGRGGWAEIRMDGREFECIRYHDFPNDCRRNRKF